MNVAPIVIKAHLVGDMKTLKLWMTEGVYSRLAADIRARKADGIVIDANILAIDENTVIMRFIEGGGPVILVVYMVQQINCIRNKAGEIIEVLQCFNVIIRNLAYPLLHRCFPSIIITIA